MTAARRLLPLLVAAMGCSDWQLLPPTGYDDDAGMNVDSGTAPVDVGTPGDAGCGAQDQRCCVSGTRCNGGLDCSTANNVCVRVQCTAAGTRCPSTGHCCGGTSCAVGHNGLSYCCIAADQPCTTDAPYACCGTMTCTSAGTGQYHCN